MKVSKTIFYAFFLTISSLSSYSQVTTHIFFPHWIDKNLVANAGCNIYGLGPNPTPITGYNIRSLGRIYLRDYLSGYGGAELSATRYAERPDQNSSISVEFPFKANKTYRIDLNAWLRHYDVTPTKKARTFPVMWIKLDNAPDFKHYENPCGPMMYEVERSVSRYSKLLGRSIPLSYPDEDKWSVSFSVLEDKSSLKIILDPSPANPALIFDAYINIHDIRITELPFEEETRSIAQYPNTTRPPRGTPGYEIASYPDEPPIRRPDQTRPTTKDFTITANQWALDYNGTSYSVNLSSIIPDLHFSEFLNCVIYGNATGLSRPPRELISLPGSFQGNNFSYEVVNNDLIIISNNNSHTAPQSNTDFYIQYKN
ncbi:hypothetical protein [Pedobacter cryoconitis]|uniref:Uncharacterized protein n=1 Tax=Pedobacter cryoconitis TaxID=188932 RepID=A0A7X0J454_9SPHI|nr:hypothetical protein [Pedobacter cryoconitis]MBB6500811.1 hypothetical protein [Pedobacter cryoconitis]